MRYLLTLIMFCWSLTAATYYVSTTGSDSTGNGSIGSPWRTIKKGMDTMASGDTLYLRGGTYTEAPLQNEQLKDGIDNANRTIIASYPGERAVFRPTFATLSHALSTLDSRDGPKYITFDGWTIDMGGKPATSTTSYDNIRFYSAHFVTFTNMHFLNNTNGCHMSLYGWHRDTSLSLNGRMGLSNIVTSCLFSNTYIVTVGGRTPSQKHSIYSHPATGHIIENSVFVNGHAAAIHCGTYGNASSTNSWGTNWVVRNNSFSNFFIPVMLAKSVGSRVQNNIVTGTFGTMAAITVGGHSNIVANNTLYGGYGGIRLQPAYTSSDMPSRNNWFVNNIAWGMTSYGYMPLANVTLGTNYWTNNIGLNVVGDWSRQVTSGHYIGATYNPQLTDPPGDLTIPGDSFARARGADLSALFDDDYTGGTRSEWDIGAYEYNTTEDPPADPPQLPLVSVVASGRAWELGSVPATFTISRAGSADGNLNVVFAMTGSAVSNVNYTLSHPSPVTINNGEWTATITMTPPNLGTIGLLNAALTIQADEDYTVSSANSATNLIYGSGQLTPGFRRTFGSGAALGRRGL